MSLLSGWSISKGNAEIYPFFHWKLYSQPLGWEGTYLRYRIYGFDQEKKEYVRIPNKPRNTFNRDEFNYFIEPTVLKVLNGNKEDSTRQYKKLVTFCHFWAEGYSSYKIVKETYKPLEVIDNPENIERETVLTID